jgi:hypothetical protein
MVLRHPSYNRASYIASEERQSRRGKKMNDVRVAILFQKKIAFADHTDHLAVYDRYSAEM